MVTGSRGVHVVVPLRRNHDFEEARAFSREVAGVLAEREPKRLTVEARKAKRGDRILIDFMRNAYAQTAVPPYAVRPKPGAPVATPLAWDELDDPKLSSRSWTIATIADRIDSVGDPWKGIGRNSRSPKRAAEQLGSAA
jgi:bifunctional non-homologous end joining protein LigD